MTPNVGSVDRLLRALLGVILILAPFLLHMPMLHAGPGKWLALIVGLVMLATAATRICPLYSILGIKTCKL